MARSDKVQEAYIIFQEYKKIREQYLGLDEKLERAVAEIHADDLTGLVFRDPEGYWWKLEGGTARRYWGNLEWGVILCTADQARHEYGPMRPLDHEEIVEHFQKSILSWSEHLPFDETN